MLSHLSGCALLVKRADGHRLRVQCLAQVETIHSQRSNVIPKLSPWPSCFLMARLFLTQALSGKLLLDIQLNQEILWFRLHWGCRFSVVDLKARPCQPNEGTHWLYWELIAFMTESWMCLLGTLSTSLWFRLRLAPLASEPSEWWWCWATEAHGRTVSKGRDHSEKSLNNWARHKLVYDSSDDMGKTPAMIAASYGSQDILHPLLWVEAEWLEEHLEKPVELFLEHCNVVSTSLHILIVKGVLHACWLPVWKFKTGELSEFVGFMGHYDITGAESDSD